MRAVIIGCGGVGGVTAGRLKAVNTDVSVVTKNPRIADAIQQKGLEVQVGDETTVYQIPAYATFPDEKMVPFDTCFLTVPPNFAEEALRNALPYLTDDATIVNLSNGLVEERLQDIVDVQRIVGGVVGFGARMMGPGKVVQTAVGEITFGALCDDYTKRDEVIGLFALPDTNIVNALSTDNLRGVRWSKLAINCAVSSLGTVGGERLGVVLRSRNARRMGLEIMTEVVKIANLSGVELEKVSGTLNLNWIALTEAEEKAAGSPGLLAKHSVLLLVGSKFRKMRSSMLASIERGRYPSVDFLNGEIVERGKKYGFATPMNKLMLDTVHDLASGNKRPSMDLLAECFQKRKSPDLK